MGEARLSGASVLDCEAAFLAGLAKLNLGASPHGPYKIIYASLYSDVRPTFVIDISEQFEARTAALMAYPSQSRDNEVGLVDDLLAIPIQSI